MEKLREEFEQIVGELEWQDVADTLQELCSNILCDTANPPHPLPPHPLPNHHIPPPPPSAAYPGMAFDAHGDIRGFAGRFPLRPPYLPHSQIVSISSMGYGPQFNPYLMHPFHLGRQAGAPFRQQYVPCQMPPQVIHSQPAYSFPPAPPQAKKNLPVVPLPEGATLHAVGMLNGEVLYAAVEASQGVAAAAPPPPSTSTPSPSGKASLPCFSRKRKCKQRHRRACNKKPPSAFMCFLREKRPALKAQIEQKDAVGVNKLLGQLWASLTKEQKAKYYEQAYAEKKLLEQMSSDGSSSNDEVRRLRLNTCRKQVAKRPGTPRMAPRPPIPAPPPPPQSPRGWRTSSPPKRTTPRPPRAPTQVRSPTLKEWTPSCCTCSAAVSPAHSLQNTRTVFLFISVNNV
ncbi:transcription factor 7-like 1 isoform X1 [Entelurus aequoreus]|uniref:transcription factor 7-like 1 isoform X1 n=1 Tax=Entelurus aequoreus TaxID=161455 RepID=UPI002B1CE35A|nr:transcription factor 7-like 1 isoform X1 [Entelurus aequoreus]